LALEGPISEFRKWLLEEEDKLPMEISELAIKKALKQGMDEVEVFSMKNITTRYEYSREIQSIRSAETIGLGLRVAKGKKTAIFATSLLNEKEIDVAVEKAAQLVKVTPEDPNWHCLNKTYGKTPVPECYDASVLNLDSSEVVENIEYTVAKVTDLDKRARVTRGVTNVTISNITIMNNYNEAVQQKGTNIYSNFFVNAVDGEESTGTATDTVRFWKELDFDSLAERTTEQAIKYLKARPIESTKIPVIIKNNLFAGILGIMLNPIINAEAAQKGRSPLATQLNQQIAGEQFTVSEDGTLPKGYHSKSFDAEGHPTQKNPIIEKGVFKTLLYDNYTAMRANTESTGNAQRNNYWGGVTPGVHNLILESGRNSLETMIKDTKKGLFIERTIGEWLSQAASGELKGTITHAFLIENGELTQPVTGVNFSGNFYQILKTGLESLGSDTKGTGNLYSPSVKLTELTIAGK